jgi:predicted component of type VI protein secretion system
MQINMKKRQNENKNNLKEGNEKARLARQRSWNKKKIECEMTKNEIERLKERVKELKGKVKKLKEKLRKRIENKELHENRDVWRRMFTQWCWRVWTSISAIIW